MAPTAQGKIRYFPDNGVHVIILGVILALIGFLTGIPILYSIGIILIIIGAILWVLGSMGRAVGGRRHYW